MDRSDIRSRFPSLATWRGRDRRGAARGAARCLLGEHVPHDVVLLHAGRRAQSWLIAVYCRVLACDFDGTSAVEGHLAPEVAEALAAARRTGIRTMLVTGRVMEDLERARVDFAMFDAVVAENGAVVWIPARARTIVLGAPPPESFLGRLRGAGIAFHAGRVVIGTWEHHASQILTLVRESGVDLQLVFNRAAVMLLPSGINKAVGVHRALQELHRSARNMIAFGDAENDLPLFHCAEIGVAARGSVPAVAAVADDRLTQPGPLGLSRYVVRLLEKGGRVSTPLRHRVVVGERHDGARAMLPGDDVNVLVSGDPRSGKSWLAGLVAERIIAGGYRACIFDPEGDYGSLSALPGVAVLGQRVSLPAASELPMVLADLDMSVIVSLTKLTQQEKCRYVCAAINALAAERVRSGLPHWILVDEAHYFFRAGENGCGRSLAGVGNVILVTYRPSLLPMEVHDTIGAYLITRTEIDSERYFMESIIGARGPRDVDPARALREVEMPVAGLLTAVEHGAHWTTFGPSTRDAAHVHHGRKYVESNFGDDRAFRFVGVNGSPMLVAHNVREFAAALGTAPIDAIRRHLVAGDFSRWSRDVLGDPDLAAGLDKLERTTAAGADPSRQELIQHVRDRYVL